MKTVPEGQVKYLTLNQAARRLRVSFGRALQLVRSFQLPAKLDPSTNRWFVSEIALDAYRKARGDRAA